DPEHGRFLQRDPLGYVDGMGLYEYVMGNPVGYLDPMGLRSVDRFLNYYANADLSYLRHANNAIAGFSDMVTFGGTNWLRERLGLNNKVDKCSDLYKYGGYAGIAGGLASVVKG